MLFITEGVVHCHSSNLRQIILKLEKEDFFGERALLGTTSRPYPLVAATFTTILKLSKANFDEVLNKYPSLKEELSTKCRILFQFIESNSV
jgi:CRP-like cAMP-binding protein